MEEFELIKKYVKPVSDQQVILGKGDDCSVIDVRGDDYWIGTTDCLVEEIHFRFPDISPRQLGYKALAVNVSDIAAMGGTPRWAHLSLAIPSQINEKAVAEFFSGFYELADRLNIQLLGGDTVASSQSLFINIHLSGSVDKRHIQYRSGFKDADLLCVTGPLGDSGAGLYDMLHATNGPHSETLIKRHLRPPLQLEQAQWLARQEGIHGMMDLSDGLWSDLKRIPNVGFDIDLADIPHTAELQDFCFNQGLDKYQFSIAGGEDYAILFGCKAELLEKVRAAYSQKFGEPFHVIGKTNALVGEIRYWEQGKVIPFNYSGFQHFKA